jgi:hypothetical protein
VTSGPSSSVSAVGGCRVGAALHRSLLPIRRYGRPSPPRSPWVSARLHLSSMTSLCSARAEQPDIGRSGLLVSLGRRLSLPSQAAHEPAGQSHPISGITVLMAHDAPDQREARGCALARSRPAPSSAVTRSDDAATDRSLSSSAHVRDGPRRPDRRVCRRTRGADLALLGRAGNVLGAGRETGEASRTNRPSNNGQGDQLPAVLPNSRK